LIVEDWQVSILVVASTVKGCVGTVAVENDDPRLKRKLLIFPVKKVVVDALPPIDGILVPLEIVPESPLEDAVWLEPTNNLVVPADTRDTAMYVHVASDMEDDEVIAVELGEVG
jgi:hypothetical protein